MPPWKRPVFLLSLYFPVLNNFHTLDMDGIGQMSLDTILNSLHCKYYPKMQSALIMDEASVTASLSNRRSLHLALCICPHVVVKS